MKMHRLRKSIAAAWVLGVAASFWVPPALTATVYKCVDEKGGVAYSDTPCPGGVRMEIPTEVLVPAPPQPRKPAAGEAEQKETGAGGPAFPGYSALALQNPSNGEVIRDNAGEGTVPVTMSLSPRLRADLGHRIAVYLDGAAWPQRFESTQFELTGVGPGSHTLRAAVLGADGSELFSSATSKFSLLRVTKLIPKGPETEQPGAEDQPKISKEPPFPEAGGEPQPGTEGMPRTPRRPPVPPPMTLPPLPAQ